MALKITSNPEFTARIKVRVPADGGHIDAEFKACFRALAISEAARFDRRTEEGITDYLRAILVGWEDVVGDDGEPVSFSHATRDQLIDAPFVQMALLDAYNAAMLGAKRGN